MLESDETGGSGIQVVFESASLEELVAFTSGFDLLLLAGETISRAHIQDIEAFITTLPGSSVSLLLAVEHLTDAHLLAALGASVRAWGVLSMEASSSELTAAIRALHEGLIAASPEVLMGMLRAQPGEARLALDEMVETLTDRESQVLGLLARGLANKQIAAELAISEHTVKFHVSSIYTKLGVANRAEAVRMGVLRGLVTL
jgi:DNA-binding NarL/FixJ family response regulator